MRYLETDTNANKDISAAVAIGAYTADGDRLIICDVSIDQAAGNGDYVMYVTRQIAGAGSAYVILPKTTMTAASGETAISGQSGYITVRSGDVLTVYVDGLAADTTTPDTTVRWFDALGNLSTLGAGAVSWSVTVNDGTDPLDGVEVWVTTDLAGANTVASGQTDALGVVTFELDAGTYYCWKQLSGYNFTNPETMAVS